MSDIVKPNADLLGAVLQAGEQGAFDDNTGTGRNHLIAKINYEECGIPRGVWVIGQRKDQSGNVEECGRVIGELSKKTIQIDNNDIEILFQKNAVVPLVVRQRYSFYSEKKPELNCQSPLFRTTHQVVHGSTHGYQCGSNCPYRSQDLSERCKMQFVLFGIAIDQDGNEEPIVMYVKGDSYIPFDNWKKTANIGKFEIDGKVIEKPVRLCTYYLSLGAVPKKKGINNYFQGYFEKGDMIESKEKFEKYLAMADELIKILDEQTVVNDKPELTPPKAEALEGDVDTGVSDAQVVDEMPEAPPASDVDKLLEEVNKLKQQVKNAG